MFDPPITTVGKIVSSPKPNIYRVSLPNGKIVIGHVPKSKRDLHASLKSETEVILELTPYDLEKARIVGLEEPEN
ncbi:MAG: translation initiation factor IF-1 [Akkermansiaceae bacterium]